MPLHWSLCWIPVPCKILNGSKESETVCETSTPTDCAVFSSVFPPTRTLVKPFVHPVTLVLIFCLHVFVGLTSSLSLSLISLSVANSCGVLRPFPCVIPILHSRGLGKGVSVLVLPWGGTAADFSYCFLQSPGSKQTSCVCLPFSPLLIVV